MNDSLIGTLSLLALFIPGFLLARTMLGSDRKNESLALGLPLGIQVFTLTVFVANFFLKVQLSLLTGWIILFLLSALFYLLGPKKSLFGPPKFGHLTRSSKIIGFISLTVFVAGFISAHWFLITDWDAVTLYDFRAKVILQTGWISDTLFRARFTDYPLLTTLSHWWMRVNGSVTPLPVYQIFLWTFALSVFFALKRLFSQRSAFLAALFITLSPKLAEQSFVAYANLPYTLYLILGLVYLYLWSEKKLKSDLVLGVVLSLMALWSRTFPFVVGSIAALFFVHKPTPKLVWLSLAMGITLFLDRVWPIDFSLLSQTLDFLYHAVITYYFPYPLLFVLAALYHRKYHLHNNYLLLAASFYWLLIFIGNYYYAQTDPNFAAIPDAAQRTVMFINPAIALFVISVLHEKETTLS